MGVPRGRRVVPTSVGCRCAALERPHPSGRRRRGGGGGADGTWGFLGVDGSSPRPSGAGARNWSVLTPPGEAAEDGGAPPPATPAPRGPLRPARERGGG